MTETVRAYLRVTGAEATEVRDVVVAEQPLSVYIEGHRLVTMLCSPFDLDGLVVGYLWTGGVIQRADDIPRLEEAGADVRAVSS